MEPKPQSSMLKVDDRPYRVDYAKSNRATCMTCKKRITKGLFRIAVIVQNPYHHDRIPKWNHPECFFEKNCPQRTKDIYNFDNIRWEDQQYIEEKMGASKTTATVAASTSCKSSERKRSNESTSALPCYTVKYTESDGPNCCGCKKPINKGEICLSNGDKEIEETWHHVECFANLRVELQFFDEGSNIPGFSTLSEQGRDLLKKALPKIADEDVPETKKLKTEAELSGEERDLKDQQVKFFEIRDGLVPLKQKGWMEMLEANSLKLPDPHWGRSQILDYLVDALLFGALEPCPECSDGLFEFVSETGYRCNGNQTEWLQCRYTTQIPKRKIFVIPGKLKEKLPFLDGFQLKVQRRLIKVAVPSNADVTDGPEIQSELRPLKDLNFFLYAFSEEKKESLTKEILLLGGTVKEELSDIADIADIAVIISPPLSSLEDNEEAGFLYGMDSEIDIVCEDFVEEAKKIIHAESLADRLELIKKMSLFSYKEPSSSFSNGSNATGMGCVSGSIRQDTKAALNKVRLRIKGGSVVDPDSCLVNNAHVYQRDQDTFTATLVHIELQINKNSYYKLQILKHDTEEKYWLFRSWGRTATTIGSNKQDEMTLEECIQKFENLFEEKTGNKWSNREFFVKKPDKKFLLRYDTEQVDDKSTPNLLKSNVKSELKQPVQDLMRLIFDVGFMKQSMLEYEIDIEKMPLGKIAKSQILEAHGVLCRLLTWIKSPDKYEKKIIEDSAKFYSLIPHKLERNRSNFIDSDEVIQQKIEMLDSLLDMEIAYNLIDKETNAILNPLDAIYGKLNTSIDVLERESDQFKLIEKYVKNTHAEIHKDYELLVEEVFIVKRSGEESRYEDFLATFKKSPNRKLLWHGSRTSNFAGILSQGLRIAPPEAPFSGYMFGKGIYFADMVSKSANYCKAKTSNSTGLLLLCDVALGNMYERFEGDYIKKLPDGYHSTWGRGKTQPDPKQFVKLENDVEVPCGPGIPANIDPESPLIHNEFIVYDVAQVKVEYIIKMNFQFKENSNNVCLQ